MTSSSELVPTVSLDRMLEMVATQSSEDCRERDEIVSFTVTDRIDE